MQPRYFKGFPIDCGKAACPLRFGHHLRGSLATLETIEEHTTFLNCFLAGSGDAACDHLRSSLGIVEPSEASPLPQYNIV